MSGNSVEMNPGRTRFILTGLGIVLLVGGGIATVVGIASGLKPGLTKAGPLLHQLATVPIGLWTLTFLGESLSEVTADVLGEVVNRFSVIGGLAAWTGYALLPARWKN